MSRTEDQDESGFQALGVVAEPLDAVTREEARSGYRVFAGKDGFEAAVPEQVIERTLRWGRAAAPNEWYGLIVARLGEDARGRHVVVLGIVPDADARATPGYVETSHASELATRALCRLLYPDGVIVGWVHGHHRVGARYSSTDRRNQATWTQTHSLGIVVDPWDPAELAVYRGPSSEELVFTRPEEEPREDVNPSDTEFRPLTTPRSPERRAGPSTRSAPGRGAQLVAGALVVAVLVLLLVTLRRERRQERAIGDLLRRVHLLERRPSVLCGAAIPPPEVPLRTPPSEPPREGPQGAPDVPPPARTPATPAKTAPVILPTHP